MNLLIFVLKRNYRYILLKIIGVWGLGIGDWDWGLGPIPNPQSPIPNPQSPLYNSFLFHLKCNIN